MRSRPWPLIIVSLILIFSPFGNALIHSVMLGIPFNNYFYYFIIKATGPELFGSLVLFPLAGASLLTFKRWSYWVLAFALAWATVDTVSGALATKNLNVVLISSSVIIFDLVLAGYFMLSSVRTIYWNARLRWWETQPRYKTNISALFRKDGKKQKCTVENISQSGVLISSDYLLKTGVTALLTLELCGEEIEITCRVLRSQKSDLPQMGVEFDHTPESKALVKKYLKDLKAKGVVPRLAPESSIESFKNWALTLVLEGKGFTPQFPEDTAQPVSLPKAS